MAASTSPQGLVTTLLVIGRNRCSTSNIAFSCLFLSSVVCHLSAYRLSHSCTLSKPCDGFKCHLAGRPTRVAFNGAVC